MLDFGEIPIGEWFLHGTAFGVAVLVAIIAIIALFNIAKPILLRFANYMSENFGFVIILMAIIFVVLPLFPALFSLIIAKFPARP